MAPDDDNETVLYEVNLDADAGIEAPFDTWLRDHVADMVQFDGFLSAEILDDSSAPEGRIRRIVQYRLRDRAALDAYLREHAPRMRQHGIEKFGDSYSTDRRVLAHREEFIRGAFSTDNCLNCGEVLRGQHCSHCGQRAKVRVLSLGTLLRDLFGDLTNFDSRIWRTLKPLAFRPGVLTEDYLRGRRTHYSPPFRMYLILSVVFFVLSTLGGNPGSAIVFDLDDEGAANVQIVPPGDAPASGDIAPATAPAAPAATATPASRPALDPERQQLVDAIVKRLPQDQQAKARAGLEQDLGAMSAEEFKPVQRVLDDPCSTENLNFGFGPEGKDFEDKLRGACRKIMADSSSFGRAVYDNLPKMMFIFLPLIAAVMFVLYLGSGRYYVEHLLFFVHYHSFFFLGGIVVVLLDRLSRVFARADGGSALDAVQGIFAVILFAYVPWYLYRAMRRVYSQGRVVTLLKYSLLGLGYLFFMTLTAVGLVLYTALTL